MGDIDAYNHSSRSGSDNCVSAVCTHDFRNISKIRYHFSWIQASAFKRISLFPMSAKLTIWALPMPKNMALGAVKSKMQIIVSVL